MEKKRKPKSLDTPTRHHTIVLLILFTAPRRSQGEIAVSDDDLRRLPRRRVRRSSRAGCACFGQVDVVI
jgi:hypothetical protein